MTDKTHSDVDRALAAFGSSTIKYRSFGAPALRPSTSRAAGASVVRPTVLDDADPFAAIPAPRASEQSPTAAATMFPLLGAAVPEASSVQVHDSARSSSSADSFQDNEYRAENAFEVPAGSFVPSPAPGYVPPVDGPVEYGDLGYVPPEQRRAPLPETPVYAPAPVPTPQPSAYAPPPMPAQAVARPADPPEWAITPPPLPEPAPPPAPVAASPRPTAPRQPDPLPPIRVEEPAPITSLAAHFPQSGIGPAGATIDAADRRSLAEMFRLLSDRADAPMPRASALAGVAAGDPGLFRRL